MYEAWKLVMAMEFLVKYAQGKNMLRRLLRPVKSKLFIGLRST